MTLSGIAGSFLAGGGLYLVWRNLEATREANTIMRAQSQARVEMEVIPEAHLTFVQNSTSLMLALNVRTENLGSDPTIDLAVSGKIKIIEKGDRVGLDGGDWSDLLRDVAKDAIDDSKRRSLTETVFSKRFARNFAKRYIHANLTQYDINPDCGVALVASVPISYKTPDGPSGAIWHAIICCAEPNQTMFYDFIGKAKIAPVPIEIIGQPVSYY